MNTGIKFRFKTRTRNTDHQIYVYDGVRVLDDDESEFKPVSAKSSYAYSRLSAVIYAEGKNIFVGAFGLDRACKDFANRPIKFAFIKIFNIKEFKQAINSFKRIISNWADAENLVRDLITADDKFIKFDYKKFSDWLILNTPNFEFETPTLKQLRAGYIFNWDGKNSRLKIFVIATVIIITISSAIIFGINKKNSPPKDFIIPENIKTVSERIIKNVNEFGNNMLKFFKQILIKTCSSK